MDDRISIPSSDGDVPNAHERRSAAAGFGLWTGLVALAVAAGVAGALLVSNDGATDEPVTAGLSAPDASGLSEADLQAVRVPGVGEVRAVVETGGELIVLVAGPWGSTIWRLSPTDAVWRIADFFPGVTLVDAVMTNDGLVTAGYQRFGDGSVLLVGQPGAMVQMPTGIDGLFVPTRITSGGESTFILTSLGSEAAAFSGGPALRLIGGNVDVLDPGARGAGIDDVVEFDSELLAVGGDNGAPAMWRVTADARLQSKDVDLAFGSSRISAVTVTRDGSLVGLVVGRLGNPLDSTAVVGLESPFPVLDPPTAGVWDELVSVGGSVLALPADGSVAYRSDDGVEWSLERVTLDNGDDLAVEDVVLTTSGMEVFAGSGGPSNRLPYLAARGSLPDSFELPDRGWQPVDDTDDAVTIHIGRIHVGIDGGIVVVRGGFGETWSQPVFADVDSVGGQVEVHELDFGFLLTADRPFDGLWYSPDGSTWQLIENGLLRVASGKGDESLVVAEGDMSLIDVSGIRPIETDEEFVSFLGGTFDWVDGVGYVTQLPDGSLRSSVGGETWTDLNVEADVAAGFVVAGRLVVRSAGSWRAFDPASGRLEPVAVPAGVSPDSLTVIRRDVVLVRDGARFWLSGDLDSWVDASLGIWNGSDDVLIDAWITDEGVVGLLGGPDQTRLHRLER